MQTQRQRRRIAIAAAPQEEPPPWWRRLFGSRQRKLRARILVRLTAALATPARGMTKGELRSYIARFEGPEVAHAMRCLAAQGLIVEDVRTVRPVRGEPRPELYWRLTTEADSHDAKPDR